MAIKNDDHEYALPASFYRDPAESVEFVTQLKEKAKKQDESFKGKIKNDLRIWKINRGKNNGK